MHRSTAPHHRSRPGFRLATALSASAIAGAGLLAVPSTLVPEATAAGCASSSKATKSGHNYSKSVTQTAGAGAKVTYEVTVGTSGINNPYVNEIVDTPPPGFSKPTAKVRVFHLIGGMKEEPVDVVAAGSGWAVRNTGWFVNASNPIRASFTYDMPLLSLPGRSVTSGGIAVNGTVGVKASFPDLTACFTTRIISPGELIDTVGADLSSSGSTQGIISDVVSGLIKGVLGGFGSSGGGSSD